MRSKRHPWWALPLLLLALILGACGGSRGQLPSAQTVQAQPEAPATPTPAPSPTQTPTEASCLNEWLGSRNSLSLESIFSWGDLNEAWLTSYSHENGQQTCTVSDASMVVLHRDDGGTATFTIDESFQNVVFLGVNGTTPVTGVTGDTITATDGIIWNHDQDIPYREGEATVTINESFALEPETVASWSDGGSDRFKHWSHKTTDQDIVADICNFVKLSDEGSDKSPVTVTIPEGAHVLFRGIDAYDEPVTASDGQTVTAVKGFFVHYSYDSEGKIQF